MSSPIHDQARIGRIAGNKNLYLGTPSLQMGLHLQNGSKNRTRKQCNSPSKTPKISEPPYFVVIRFQDLPAQDNAAGCRLQYVLRFINWEDDEGDGRLRRERRQRSASPPWLLDEKEPEGAGCRASDGERSGGMPARDASWTLGRSWPGSAGLLRRRGRSRGRPGGRLSWPDGNGLLEADAWAKMWQPEMENKMARHEASSSGRPPGRSAGGRLDQEAWEASSSRRLAALGKKAAGSRRGRPPAHRREATSAGVRPVAS